jgi:hypothetical protein
LHFGGLLSEQFELVGMRNQAFTFQNPPSFNDLVARVRTIMNVECDLCLHGRYDMCSNRPIYVMLPLGSENEWQLYKSYASQSGLKGAEVVAEIAPLQLFLTLTEKATLTCHCKAYDDSDRSLQRLH